MTNFELSSSKYYGCFPIAFLAVCMKESTFHRTRLKGYFGYEKTGISLHAAFEHREKLSVPGIEKIVKVSIVCNCKHFVR